MPDFILGGAPRSGTQWLYSVAVRHPKIEMARPLAPEPKFFLRDDLYRRGLEYYSKTWFASIPADKLAGEKSTNYLESSTAAERIRSSLPDVRLVFALRNPVDRAYSNFLWSRMNLKETEDFEKALALEETRERNMTEELRYARPHALFSRGLYAELLRPYFDRFPRSQFLILKYEDIATKPGAVAESLHRFLGVAPRPEDGEAQGRLNSARNGEDTRMNPETRRMLAERYAEPNARLYDLLGADFEPWSDVRL
ncbi:MAG TPA: sulfotransferase [Candidatus Rubrimentiphilum sp.]|nr:sulfotransferase [Candidatus Rubrimentiphilum sp.]